MWSRDRLGIFDGWFYDEVQGARRGSGPEIACLLMQRLAALEVPVEVLAEYSRGHWTADAEGKARDFARTAPVLASRGRRPASSRSIWRNPLKPLMVNPGIDAMFRSDHHSAEGNRATAEAIMQELGRHRLLTHSPSLASQDLENVRH